MLAAFEGWDSLNVLLAVYDEAGKAYAGLYKHSGEIDDLAPGTRRGVMAQGRASYAVLDRRYADEAYVRETGEAVKPLELLGR